MEGDTLIMITGLIFGLLVGLGYFQVKDKLRIRKLEHDIEFGSRAYWALSLYLRSEKARVLIRQLERSGTKLDKKGLADLENQIGSSSNPETLLEDLELLKPSTIRLDYIPQE